MSQLPDTFLQQLSAVTELQAGAGGTIQHPVPKTEPLLKCLLKAKNIITLPLKGPEAQISPAKNSYSREQTQRCTTACTKTSYILLGCTSGRCWGRGGGLGGLDLEALQFPGKIW